MTDVMEIVDTLRQNQAKQCCMYIHRYRKLLKQHREAEQRKGKSDEVWVRNLTSRPC